MGAKSAPKTPTKVNKNRTIFGSSLGRVPELFFIVFGFQNGCVFGAKMGAKTGSVARRLVLKN